MRHDYNLPAEWPAMTEQEKHEFFVQERCRRQAQRQSTRHNIEQQKDRFERKLEARSETVTLDDFR